MKTLGEVYVGLMEDSADVPLDTARIAITTDSFVVDPLFFGNGDIGKIAVAGTVNDLAVSGAKPRYLTLALIIEEGFPISDLVRVLESVRATALEAGVLIVAGDTKVVRRGEADGLYINTTGVGLHNRPEPPAQLAPPPPRRRRDRHRVPRRPQRASALVARGARLRDEGPQ